MKKFKLTTKKEIASKVLFKKKSVIIILIIYMKLWFISVSQLKENILKALIVTGAQFI